MDRAEYFKKKGSTVDAKFARLHRRSIDQRSVRGMGFMENRTMGSLEELAFSPVKEDRLKAAMPPPMAAPPKAKKGNGAHNKSSSGPTKPTPAPSVKAAVPASGMSRRDKLIKWKEEKEMKRKQMASKAKPQVFRVSKALDHKEDANLFMCSKNEKTKSTAKPAAKPVSRPAPVPQRATRSSTRSSAKPPTNGVKDTSKTRAPVKKVESAPSTRARRGPPPPPPTSKPASSRMPSTRPVSSDRAPSTRQSARLATKQAPPQIKTGRTTRGAKVEKPAPVVEKAAPVVEKVAPVAEKEEETVEKENVEFVVEPTKPVIDEATFNITNQRGSSMLAETFGRPEGFTFSMAVPELPFTPISPASASIFLFPTVKSNTALTPSQRRCSTPYSLRPLRSLGQQQGHGPMPPQPDMTEGEDVAMETETCIPVEPETENKSETTENKPETTENKPETTEDERTPMPQEEVAMETEDSAKAETNVQGEAMTGEPVERKPSEGTDTSPTSPLQEKDLQYFKNLVSSETTRLLDRCSIWEKVMSDNKLSEEVCGEIRSSIGKAKLLIDQRFKQFLGLIKNCEFGLGEKVTHCSDLEGFWEMIYFQVEDVDALFKDLEKLQANNWQREEKKMDKPKIIKKKKPVTKKPVGGDAAAKRIAARERLLAAKAAMQAKATRKAESEKVVFEGGFFKVESPARKATPAKTKEIREDGLSRQALQNRTNIMASPASNLRSPALLKRTNIMASPASTMCSPALKKMTIMASPGFNVCSPALQSKRTKIMASPVTNLCSPLRRKTRKSSMGFGLSKAASLFTPEKDTPVKGATVQDLISWE